MSRLLVTLSVLLIAACGDGAKADRPATQALVAVGAPQPRGRCGDRAKADRSSALESLSIDLPERSGRVVDNAGLISPAAEATLTARLDALERRTTDQLVVVTLPELGDEAIERVALQLGQGWGIGRGDVDNGVLLLVAPNDRKVRIEVGCGLEGLLTDERAAAIIRTDLLPPFRAGAFEQGIEAGVAKISETLASVSTRPMPKRI